MNNKIRRKRWPWVVPVCIIGTFLLMFTLMITIILVGPEDINYQTTQDLADYGDYRDQIGNQGAAPFILSFFPEKLDTDFKDIQYSFTIGKRNQYGSEAYLEFTIEDSSVFSDCVSQISAEEGWTPFPYDENYMQCVKKDVIHLDSADGTSYYYVDAKIGRILYSAKEQKIIYSAIQARESGYAHIDDLTVFFQRFDIDVLSYAERADVHTPYMVRGEGKYVKTTDISGYLDTRLPQWVSELLPDQISTSFEDISYYLNAEQNIDRGFSLHLEFTIPDTAAFDTYTENLCPAEEWERASYDREYLEHNFYNVLRLAESEDGNPTNYNIRWAKIGKVLISEEEQRIIFYFLGVTDNTYADTDELGDFFDRFSIDPKDYESTAFPYELSKGDGSVC